MMKKKLFLSLMITVILTLFSCKSYKLEYIKYKNQIDEVELVNIYIVDGNWFWGEECFFGGSSPYHDLISEENIRNSNPIKIELPENSAQLARFMTLLYSAKRAKIRNNKVKIKYYKGIKLYWEGGMIIDVYYKNLKCIKDTYIMQNGEAVFYKKGEEGLYYKMPKLILNKYYVSNSEVFVYEED
ncbi:hypothetical protein [Treponema pedis]|uniref:hypothetical protein n=2 Tax=Treponema pedis TaxID=409322 RepID=UPI0019801E79|nr:hypothetical protein [Treponema pedis]QSI04814.1 hypothetical protein DYQ05_07700 [Treponema pedis]